MKWTEGGQFEKAPSGSHLARCYAVIDLGSQPHSWGGETRLSRDVRISFELPYATMEGTYNKELEGKPFTVHLQVKQSLHPASNLRKLLEGWRGKRFDSTSIELFRPSSLLGQCCRLALVESEAGYMNIDAISPATPAESGKMPAGINKQVFFSMAPEEFKLETFQNLNERTQEKIKGTPEWRFLQGSGKRGFDAKEDADLDGANERDEIPF